MCYPYIAISLQLILLAMVRPTTPDRRRAPSLLIVLAVPLNTLAVLLLLFTLVLQVALGTSDGFMHPQMDTASRLSALVVV